MLLRDSSAINLRNLRVCKGGGAGGSVEKKSGKKIDTKTDLMVRKDMMNGLDEKPVCVRVCVCVCACVHACVFV